jgi:hypothetical protein
MKPFALPRSFRWMLAFALAVTLAVPPISVLIPSTGSKLIGSDQPALYAGEPKTPFLAAFIRQVMDGQAGRITGIYSSGIFAVPVVQQPSGNPGFVSSAPDTITQFQSSSYYGSLGFLAHNTLAGRFFSRFGEGDSIVLVHGDGSYQFYRVAQILHYQAVNPESQFSDFIDLENGSRLNYYDLFLETYGVSGRVVLQTCIDANGNGSWGRLFIIAFPMRPTAASILLKAKAE